MEGLYNVATTVGDRFSTNIQTTFQNMSPEKWIRIVIIAGACTPSSLPSPSPPNPFRLSVFLSLLTKI